MSPRRPAPAGRNVQAQKATKVQTKAKPRRQAARRAKTKPNQQAAERPMALRVVGHSPARPDGLIKTAGLARYADDLNPPGCLVGLIVPSPHAHAKLLRVDAREARRVPGVHAVVTAADFPFDNNVGVVKLDQPLLAKDRLRWFGDRIAIIAAQTREAAQAAAARLVIEAEPLPGIFDPVQALADDAPQVHAEGNLAAKMIVRKGDMDRALASAEVVIERWYTTNYQEHAYLETNGIVAEPMPDGSMLLRGSMQCPFYVQKIVARVMGLPHASVRAVQTTTGGGFGGKEDYPSEPAACAAVLARITGRPVKIIYRRDEDIAWSSKRHATTIKHTLMAKRDGTLVGVRAEIYVDAGAYLGLSAIVAERANASAGGPYRVPHVHVDTFTVYTNNPFGGAYRGFGAPQVTFALESQMDLLAAELGRDPIELREQNCLHKGDRTPVNDRVKDEPQIGRALALGRQRARWAHRRREFQAHNASNPDLRKGLGVAAMTYGCCLHAGGQHLEGSASLVQVHPDASVSVNIGGTEIGQGAFMVMAQLAAESLGLPLERIHVLPTDTAAVPDSGPTVASRTTIMSGNAVLDATRQISGRLLARAAKELGVPARRLRLGGGRVLLDGKSSRLAIDTLVQLCFARKDNLTASGWYAPPHKNWNRETGTGQAYSVYCDAVMVAEVSVDTVTGLVTLDRMTCVHDVGQAIFRAGIEGQIQGGVVQGYGYATMENLVVREGRILNPTFTDYLLPTSLDLPEVDITLIEEPYAAGPYGAKGIGEPSLIPVPAAIANAVADALDLRLFDLPLSPERVKMAWESRAGAPH